MKMRNTMEYKGFSAEIMEAHRLVGDQIFDLPQGKALQVYYADEFLQPPENWMKGQGVFVVPVRPDKGLWFDWRRNDQYNTAILPTVKGCNPITGLQTSGFHMETYSEKCPKHGCGFIAERFCTECGYKWPPQNYMSPGNIFWWDGFRADDGTVRQFFFSEEELRDIASHMIGKENTVPAFGFTFFTPKERREHSKVEPSRGFNTIITFPNWWDKKGSSENLGGGGYGTGSVNLFHSSTTYSAENKTSSESKTSGSLSCNSALPAAAHAGSPMSLNADDGVSKKISKSPLTKCGSAHRFGTLKKKSFSGGIITPDSAQVNMVRTMRSAAPKKDVEVSIGAGARIRQSLNRDTYPLESWKEVPDASMTIYFIFHEKFEELKSKGMRDISSAKEGMLQGLPVG